MKNLIPVLALLMLGGACGLHDQTEAWSKGQIEELLEEISREHAAQPVVENLEQGYLACVAAEFMREYSPAGVGALTRLEKDVVRAQAFLECQGALETDADASNKADEAFLRL